MHMTDKLFLLKLEAKAIPGRSKIILALQVMTNDISSNHMPDSKTIPLFWGKFHFFGF